MKNLPEHLQQLVDGSERIRAFVSVLSRLPPGRLLDLGAGHGLFAQAAHSLGWTVVAVDVRATRFPDTPGIDWVVSDVAEFEFDAGHFDLISVLGLLYHLDIDTHIRLMRKCAGTLTLVDTELSTDTHPATDDSPAAAALSPLTKAAGYVGRHYMEPGNSDGDRQEIATASWGNATSFWPTGDEQIRLLKDCGFTEIWQLMPMYKQTRTFFMCYPD